MRTVKYISLLLITLVLWGVFIVFGITKGFLLKSISSDRTPKSFVDSVEGLIEKEFVGNLAMVLIENGKVVEQFYHSEDQQIDANTIYQLASVSKWVTAWGVFTLIENGELDLDTPIEQYLTRWHLPASDFDHDKVTIRRLLSHTSGLVDGLGYRGYGPGEYIQTPEESLTKASDASDSDGAAKIGFEPGSKYQYSGAGYTILQLIIEEVSGQSFSEYMEEAVFKPLGMNQSTYVLADSLDWQIATLYNNDGSISDPYRYTALAAASLYSCTADLTKFLLAHVEDNKVLSQQSLKLMSTKEAFQFNVGIHGLGPALYSQGDEKSNVIGHNGNNLRPVINTAARIDLNSKNGLVVLEMGSWDIASIIGDEWIFDNAGIADYVVIKRNKDYLIILFVIGFITIIASFIIAFIKRKKLMPIQEKS